MRSAVDSALVEAVRHWKTTILPKGDDDDRRWPLWFELLLGAAAVGTVSALAWTGQLSWLEMTVIVILAAVLLGSRLRDARAARRQPGDEHDQEPLRAEVREWKRARRQA